MASAPYQVKKFYFLEYFYILLKSIEKHAREQDALDMFKLLRETHSLGDSKYKRLTSSEEEQSSRQVKLLYYTFKQVAAEALEYRLIDFDEKNGKYSLSMKGKELLSHYEEGNSYEFNKKLFPLMEEKFKAFYEIINFCYEQNKNKSGLLVFPLYSPIKLDFKKSEIKTTKDILDYSRALQKKLEQDIEEFIGKSIDLTQYNDELIQNLKKACLLPQDESGKFAPDKYNSMIIRFRKFWLKTFLNQIYGYKSGFPSFDIWTYRGKQIGALHVTEFYPGFSGRIVYPTSVIVDHETNGDFEKLFDYANGYSLYIHSPSWADPENQDKFVDALLDAYFSSRKTNRSYFVGLPDIRELVCYKMRISQHLFNVFLEKAYLLNLKGELKVKISLEADKLPHETNAMYLKREPVMVNAKYRNIIAIDIAERRNQ
ncbi:MAG: hypothetical protein KAW12_19970 [Candidatus Aminicenantes bacterium]|nr:hypothetical protein [Candidatus Aminicenantes bacterium]